jgi:hypothetical protein
MLRKLIVPVMTAAVLTLLLSGTVQAQTSTSPAPIVIQPGSSSPGYIGFGGTLSAPVGRPGGPYYQGFSPAPTTPVSPAPGVGPYYLGYGPVLSGPPVGGTYSPGMYGGYNGGAVRTYYFYYNPR